MSTHVPGARTVLIHGVCVSSNARRRGIASALLAEYQRRLAATGSYECALLIAHEEKATFYERVGFKSRGLSKISFAGISWIELEWVVPLEKPSDLQSTSQAIPPGLLEALQGQGATPRLQGQLLLSFQGGILDVSEESEGDQRSNGFDLLCINESCRSVILKRGVAVLRERESVQVSCPCPRLWSVIVDTLCADGAHRQWSPRPPCSTSSTRENTVVACDAITDGIREHWVL